MAVDVVAVAVAVAEVDRASTSSSNRFEALGSRGEMQPHATDARSVQ